MRPYKSRPFRRDRVYLTESEVARLAECGCPTCAALLGAVQHDAARRLCLHKEALEDARVLTHLERVLEREVGFGDPIALAPLVFGNEGAYA